jgi:hypothetical protein
VIIVQIWEAQRGEFRRLDNDNAPLTWLTKVDIRAVNCFAEEQEIFPLCLLAHQ